MPQGLHLTPMRSAVAKSQDGPTGRLSHAFPCFSGPAPSGPRRRVLTPWPDAGADQACCPIHVWRLGRHGNRDGRGAVGAFAAV
jgi:hypothetical protein